MKCLCGGEITNTSRENIICRIKPSRALLYCLKCYSCEHTIRTKVLKHKKQPPVCDSPPYQPHYEEEVSSLRLAVAWHCAAAATVSSLLGEHLPPDDQLTHPLLGRQRQEAVVLAVQAHIQQVLFRQVVGDQVGLEGE